MFQHSGSKHLNLLKAYNAVSHVYHAIPVVKKKEKKKRMVILFKCAGISMAGIFLLAVIMLAFHWFNMKLAHQNIADRQQNAKRIVAPIENKRKQPGLVQKKIAYNSFPMAYNIGEARELDSDYLMIVDDHAATLKSYNISRHVDYRLEQSANGLFIDLQINYAYSGIYSRSKPSYKTRVQAYIPSNSQLIRAETHDGAVLRDNAPVQIYNRGNKAVVSANLEVRPGKIGYLRFYYKLSDELNILAKNNRYKLQIEKPQSSDNLLLTVDLKLLNKVKSYYPTGFHVQRENDRRIRWESDLVEDREFSVNF